MKSYYAVFGIRDKQNNWLSFNNAYYATIKEAQKHIERHLINYLLDNGVYDEESICWLTDHIVDKMEPINDYNHRPYHSRGWIHSCQTSEANYWIEKDVQKFATMTIL